MQRQRMACVIGAALAVSACAGGQDKAEASRALEQRQQQAALLAIAQAVPHDAEGLVVVPAPADALRAAQTHADERWGEWSKQSMAALVDGPGVAPGSPVLYVSNRSGFTLVALVQDAAKLQEALRARYPNAKQAEQPMAGGQRAWTQGEVAWHIEGGALWLITSGGWGAMERTCRPCKPNATPLAQDVGWRAFAARGVADTAAAFLPSALAQDVAQRLVRDLTGALTRDAQDALAARLQAIAFGVSLTGEQAGSVWLGVDDEATRQLKAVLRAPAAWTAGAVPPDAIGHLRLGVEPVALWTLLRPALGEVAQDGLAALTQLVPEDGSPTLAQRLSGDLVLWVAPAEVPDGLAFAPGLALYGAFGLREAADVAWLEATLTQLAAQAGVTLGEREVSGARVLTVKAPDDTVLFSVYLQAQRVLVGAGALQDDAALRSLSGQHKHTGRDALSAQTLAHPHASIHVGPAMMERIGEDRGPLKAGVAMMFDLSSGPQLQLALADPRPWRSLLVAGMMSALAERRPSDDAADALSMMARGAQSYFTAEQRYSAPDSEQPWHVPDPRNPATSVGMPMIWDHYVFPGGDGFTMRSVDAIPKGGATVQPPLSGDPTISAATNWLGAPMWFEASSFRYTYESRGSGDQATAILRAEADLNPATPQVTTVEIRLSVDAKTQEVVISPAIITHDGE